MEFINFAFTGGKLYNHYWKQGTFVVPENKQRWGNDAVYGGVFYLKDSHFYIRSLDAYQQCSLSLLGVNHIYDLHHRVEAIVTPISFSNVEEFVSLRYKERNNIDAQMYVGNIKHPKINQILSSKQHKRILQGLQKDVFNELLKEVYP